ncbi:unnamed protein product [Knipowitschia caucasica]
MNHDTCWSDMNIAPSAVPFVSTRGLRCVVMTLHTSLPPSSLQLHQKVRVHRQTSVLRRFSKCIVGSLLAHVFQGSDGHDVM